MNQEKEFESVQACKQPFVWVIIIALALFLWYSMYQQILLDNPVGNSPAADLFLIILWLIFGIGFPLGLMKTKLIIKLDSQKFYYRLFPLHLRMHSSNLEDIEKMEAAYFRPILDFGGWGIRWGRKGKGYIISDTKAVKVNLKAGKPVYFSSDEAERVVEVYQRLKWGYEPGRRT